MSDVKDTKFSNIKAILIFLIVFTNCICSYNFRNSELVISVTKIIYAFMMPIFCIISGYYSRSKNSTKQLIRLFGLFMVMNFIFYIYEYISTGFISSDIIKYSSWYLIDLIIWRLWNKQIKNKTVFLIMNILVVLLLSIVPNNFSILNIDNIIYYFSYFLLGNSFNIFDEEDKNFKLSSIKLSISLLFIVIIVLLFKFDLSFYYTLYNKNSWLVLIRLLFYVCNYFIATSLFVIIPNKDIKLITDIGRSSLTIYVLQGLFTIIFSDVLHNNKYIIILGLLFSILLCLALGNGYVNKALKSFMELFLKWYSFVILASIIFLSVTVYYVTNSKVKMNNEEIRYNVVSNNNIEDIKNRSISIGYSGSIMLLEENLKDSYDGNKYDFNYMFKYMKEYYESTDYMIGTIEGVVDDKNTYTLHNIVSDGIKINSPSTLFKSLKDNGFDLVNLSNKWLLNYGEDGIVNTISNINNSGLDYTGIYKEDSEKNPKIVNIEGINIGILSYTLINDEIYESDLYDKYGYSTSYIIGEDSNRFNKVKERVKENFKYLNNNGADIIVVIVDGNKNDHSIDSNQKVWNDIFHDYGADIVFGGYSSNIQRIEYYDDTVIVNSTGSLFNNGIGKDNDLSYMVKVYIDKNRKDVNCISLIPTYSYKGSNSGSIAIPIYTTLKNRDIYNLFSQKDIDRINNGLEVISSISMNERLTNVLEKEYFYFVDGYKRQMVDKIELSNEEMKSPVYKMISNSKRTCYVGDQYTVGSTNGGFGWFEPLVSTVGNEYVKISNTNYTSEDAKNNYFDLIHNSNCDLYVVALGTNDIRNNYLNVDEYMHNMEELLKNIKKDIIMVAPWQPLELEYEDTAKYLYDMELFSLYNKRIKKYCDEGNCLYINPNVYIKNTLNTNYVRNYYDDSYLPNSSKGIELFSRSILH